MQSAVINKFKDMIFLPIETSGEGEVNAHSRVQMALGEAKAKAKAEFETVLKSTGKSLDEIRAFVADHRELRRPFYHVPHREGVAGTAAQFVLHVSDADGFLRAAVEALSSSHLQSEGGLTMETRYMVGLDVGSTTVKAVVTETATDRNGLAGLPAPRNQTAGKSS